ncbi:MAG: type III-B CRISPR module RAMP protein Cmr4 [Anaerolineae bacterium]|nr:type III-B CRISPR module RAMP protein Cmr4 [Anaerolineae bacterium]
MFEASGILFIYVETPLHAGTGRGLSGVDLPIQRERVTGYPIVQASSLKGRLRAEARKRLPDKELEALFGPDTERASEHAGALSPGDAKLLLFPVRSLGGVFAWTTSCDVLARFRRDAAIAGLSIPWQVPSEPAPGEALVSGEDLLVGDRVVLEEFTFSPRQENEVAEIGRWLANHALPKGDQYRYWKEALPRRLAVLHKDVFRDFALFSTEVVTRVRLEPERKTVAEGALWTEEYLPVDTLLYAPLMATPTRAPECRLSGKQVLEKVLNSKLTHTVLGGDETVGRGMVALRLVQGEGGAV